MSRRRRLASVPSRVLPFLVSGSSEEALAAQAGRLREFVDGTSPSSTRSTSPSALALGRAHLPHRAVAVVGGLSELADCLDGFERGEFVEALVQGVARRDRQRRVRVLRGRAAQWDGMALALWEASPVFAASMAACAAALGRYVDWSLEDVLRGAAGRAHAGAGRCRAAGAVRGDGVAGAAVAVLRRRRRRGRRSLAG